MQGSIAHAIARQNNDHGPIAENFKARTGIGWHEPTPAALSDGVRVSVLIPARNAAGTLPTVLDGLAAQDTAADVEVIVVDDASTDATVDLLTDHPVVDIAVRLAEHSGSAVARNVAAYLAGGDTLVFLDADMVLPHHVLTDLAARARDDAVLVGFRHNLVHRPDLDLQAVLRHGEPSLEADHRVCWKPPVNVPMFYSGQVYRTPIDGRPLDHTREFIELGQGRTYLDWDLPRMVVTALVAVSRRVFSAVSGFHPAFDAHGWGCEDTLLGAVLIAHGAKIIPVRQARGWHLDPPDATSAWRAKFATVPGRIALYRDLLNQPVGARTSTELIAGCRDLIREAVTLR